jgi:transcriptional regulator with XRE-family HTH domain
MANLRALREARGLSLEQVAEKMRAEGLTTTKFGLSNFETGKKRGSAVLVDAYSRALGISSTHIRQEAEVTQLVRNRLADLELKQLEQVAA